MRDIKLVLYIFGLIYILWTNNDRWYLSIIPNYGFRIFWLSYNNGHVVADLL